MARSGVRPVATALALSLALAGCQAANGGAGDQPYRVLVLGGLSADGVLADNAATSVLAAKASVANVNDKGGLGGRKVEIDVADDAADPTTAVTKLRSALNSGEKPDLVLNSGPSTITNATLPILKQAGVLSMNIGPTAGSSDPTQFPLNFDLSPSVADNVKGFLPTLTERGLRTVAVLHGSTSYGETFGAKVGEILPKSGIRVVGNEEYDVAALDMTPQLSALRAARPDALILDAYGAPTGYVLKGIDKLGWDVPILGNTSVTSTGLVATAPPKGLLGTSLVRNLTLETFASTVHTPGAERVNQAVAQMKALGPIKSTLILAYNYDSMGLIAAAVEKAGTSTDPAKIAAALEDPAVQEKADTAILSRYNFTARSHAPTADAAEYTFIPPATQTDGQFRS